MPEFGMFIEVTEAPNNNEPIPHYSYAKPGKLQPSPCCLIGYKAKSYKGWTQIHQGTRYINFFDVQL